MDYYHRPPLGFHFKVEFLSSGFNLNDIKFQEVSGLSVSLTTEDYIEGGENRFTHKLPVRTSYAQLELKRGLLLNSKITEWVKSAVEKFEIKPLDLIVTLLNEHHMPLASWNIKSAYPVEWTINSFNAEESKLVIESLKLNYQYFDMKKSPYYAY